MGLFDQFPYTNFHELNLTWILEALKEIQTTIDQFVAINALKYADPIQWNITSQYEKNTIVIDPLTGTAYISVQPVPAGVAITREEYWSVVFDLGSFVVRAAKNFTVRHEDETTLTATFSTPKDSWLIWGDTLYKALVNITAGDSYVVGGNIAHFTMEDVIGHLEDLQTTDKSNLVAAINEVLQTLSDIAGDLDDLSTTDKSNLVAAINEVVESLSETAEDLDDLSTYAKNRPYINVKDFGAVGDGITDDADAFKAAFDSVDEGSSIIIPYGSYYLTYNPDDNSKNINWLADIGTSFSGAGIGDPSASAGTFISPVTNKGDIISGIRRKFNLNMIPSPLGNGTVAYCSELIDGSPDDYISITGSIANGDSKLYTSDDISEAKIGDAVLLISPTDANWPSGDTRANSMRIVSIESGYITIGPDISSGAGAAVATPWSGATINAGSFKIRKRAWNCVQFLGVSTSDNPNVDRYDWGLNIVNDINGTSASNIELEVNLNNDTPDIARAIFITGRGQAMNTAAVALDIQRNDGRNWEWGAAIRQANYGLLLEANRAIGVITSWHDADDGLNKTILQGITFDNIDAAIYGWRPSFATKQLVNGASAIVLQRQDDNDPQGALIAAMSNDMLTQLFRLDASGYVEMIEARPQDIRFNNCVGQTGCETAFYGWAPSVLLQQRVSGATALIIHRLDDTDTTGALIECISRDMTDELFRVGADGTVKIKDLQITGNAVQPVTTETVTGYITVKDNNGNNIKLAVLS